LRIIYKENMIKRGKPGKVVYACNLSNISKVSGINKLM